MVYIPYNISKMKRTLNFKVLGYEKKRRSTSRKILRFIGY